MNLLITVFLSSSLWLSAAEMFNRTTITNYQRQLWQRAQNVEDLQRARQIDENLKLWSELCRKETTQKLLPVACLGVYSLMKHQLTKGERDDVLVGLERACMMAQSQEALATVELSTPLSDISLSCWHKLTRANELSIYKRKYGAVFD